MLQTSYPDTITWVQEHVPAIVWTTHAGQETGHAVADVLFGDVNPAGRLTQTWSRSSTADLQPDLLDYDIISTRPDLPVRHDEAALPVRPRPVLHALPYSHLRVDTHGATGRSRSAST